MTIREKGRTIVSAAALSFAMLVGTSVAANAVLLDFIDFIDNVNPNDEEAVQSTISLGGFNIIMHGFNGAPGVGDFNSGPFAYLDGGDAGVGVCQIITMSAQCNPAGDDNVTAGEILSISFDQDVKVSALFRNDGHTPLFGLGKFVDVAVGAGAFNTETLIAGINLPTLGAGLVGAPSYILAAGQALHLKFNNQQFYLSGLEVSAVPLPPAALLFGSALAGMGFLGRRRKQKATAA